MPVVARSRHVTVEYAAILEHGSDGLMRLAYPAEQIVVDAADSCSLSIDHGMSLSGVVTVTSG